MFHEFPSSSTSALVSNISRSRAHAERDSKQAPTGAETGTAPRAEAVRATAWRTIPQTTLDEVSTRPVDDARECRGCFGAMPRVWTLRVQARVRLIEWCSPSGSLAFGEPHGFAGSHTASPGAGIAAIRLNLLRRHFVPPKVARVPILPK
jgi:hypothetical protein